MLLAAPNLARPALLPPEPKVSPDVLAKMGIPILKLKDGRTLRNVAVHECG